LTPLAVPPSPTVIAYQNYMLFSARGASANTGPVTAQVAGLAALPVFIDKATGPAVLTGGEIQPNNLLRLAYDSALNVGGGGFHLFVSPTTLTTGTVTSVASGAGLSGGPITGAGTLSLATIPGLRISSNITGGNAVPIGNTWSAILDALVGSTQGAIIQRTGAAWVTLGPGTIGQNLTAQGAAANLIWTGGVTRGINAAGATQGTATLLTAEHNEVTVVAAATGVIMANVIGMPQTIVNRGANTLSVYPPVGAQIDALGVNVPATIASNASATYTLYGSTQAYTEA